MVLGRRGALSNPRALVLGPGDGNYAAIYLSIYLSLSLSLSLYIYIYIYIYVCALSSDTPRTRSFEVRGHPGVVEEEQLAQARYVPFVGGIRLKDGQLVVPEGRMHGTIAMILIMT